MFCIICVAVDMYAMLHYLCSTVVVLVSRWLLVLVLIYSRRSPALPILSSHNSRAQQEYSILIPPYCL